MGSRGGISLSIQVWWWFVEFEEKHVVDTQMNWICLISISIAYMQILVAHQFIRHSVQFTLLSTAAAATATFVTIISHT